MIQLVPMTGEEFETYLAEAIAHYAGEHVKAGNWDPSEALERSEQEYRQLLPQGPATEGQLLYTIKDVQDGENIGMIWLAIFGGKSGRRGFIYDFSIAEAKRGRGYGSQALQAIEQEARTLGLESIGLHVFTHNRVARRLYEKAGYEVRSLNMAKRLE